MKESNLEYRMYGLVPYNISPIQQGIQFGHAVVEYGQLAQKNKEILNIYNKWADHDKTFIILNGGTTNENIETLGSLQNHSQLLKDSGIFVAEFKEPDLNNTLTAVVFLVDERVFNLNKYPDYIAYIPEIGVIDYTTWVKAMGGDNNLFLRKFLNQFKLA